MGAIIFLFTASQLYVGNIRGHDILIYVPFNLLALSFWIAKEIIYIDIAEKRIGEGVNIFGLKRISWIMYSGIE
jgi:hypothetical protein